MSRSRRYTAEEVIKTIHNESCIARTIVSDPIDDHHWLFFLKQFKDPAFIPEPRPLEPGAEPGTVWHFSTREWIQQPQGLYAQCPPGAIQLMSGTLLPRYGYIELYDNANVSQGHQHVVALFNSGDNPDRYLYAVDEEKIDTNREPCVIKACFENDAGTNAQWWIKGQPLFDFHGGRYPIATRFSQLRSYNRKFDSMVRPVDHNKNERNEVIFYPRLQGFVGLAAVTSSSADIVNALYRQLLVKTELGIQVPVLRIRGDKKEYNVDQKVSALLLETECGNEFIFKMHALILRMGGEAPEEWQRFLAKLKSQLSDDNSMPGSSGIALAYKSILQTYFFHPKQAISWPFLLKVKSNKLVALFIHYAAGDRLGVSSVEMLEALNGGGWKQWDEFKNLLVQYSHYLKGLHRFPNKGNAQDFYETVYKQLPKTSLQEEKRIAVHASNQSVVAAIKARKLWSDIVSHTDQHLTTPRKHLAPLKTKDVSAPHSPTGAIFAAEAVKVRMQKLNVPGDHDAHINKITTYLQEKSVILLAFDAKKVFQKEFVSLEALSHVELSVRPDRGDAYVKSRDRLEDKIFEYLSPELEEGLHLCGQARPRYAFLCIANNEVSFKLPSENYGKSYVVLNHKIKFNSLFVPHNIISQYEHSSSYKIPTPATYFTLEVLLERVTDDELLGLVNAATGLMPDKHFGQHISDLQAYIPPVNLFDTAVVDKIFIHPREYVLTPTEKNWVAERGIDLVNTDNYIGERDMKQWVHVFKTDNVAELKQMVAQDPKRLKQMLSPAFLIEAIESGSAALYSYIATQVNVPIDLTMITQYAKTATMLLFLYKKLVEQSTAPVRLDAISAKNISNLLKTERMKSKDTLDVVVDLILQLPDNAWTEPSQEEKTQDPVSFNLKTDLIALCLTIDDETLLEKLWEIAYIREQDLAPYYFMFYASSSFDSIKEDLKKQRTHLDTPEIQKLILSYVNKDKWGDIVRLRLSIPHLKMPLRIAPDKTILYALEKCEWLQEVMPLCVATPGFFDACKDSVPAVMYVTAKDNTLLLSYLKRYFPDVFSIYAARWFAVLDRDFISDSARKLFYQSGNFMGLPNNFKVSAIKIISTNPSSGFAFDAFDAILSEKEVEEITYNLQYYQDAEIGRQACGKLIQRIDAEGHLKPVDNPITNLSVLEEKSPTPQDLASALQVIAWKMINNQARFADYEKRLSEILVGYTVKQQRDLGVALLAQDNYTLLQSDIASFIGRHKDCMIEIFLDTHTDFKIHPNLIFAYLNLNNDQTDNGYLISHLLHPGIDKIQEVKEYLTQNPNLKTRVSLMYPVFLNDNPDTELLTLLSENHFLHKDIVRIARCTDYEKLLTNSLRSIAYDEQTLLRTLEIVLQYPDVNIALVEMLISKLKTNPEVSHPSKIRCWVYALEHLKSAQLRVCMESVLTVDALKRTAKPYVFTLALRTLLNKSIFIRCEDTTVFLLNMGASFSYDDFTKLISSDVEAIQKAVLLTLKEQEQSSAALSFVSQYLEILMRMKREGHLFELILWISANLGNNAKPILAELHAKALSSNQATVLDFYFDHKLVANSAALTQYLNEKITLTDAKIEPVALRFARTCDWDMQPLFVQYSKQNTAITPKTGSQDYIQKAADFIREYELTSTQQTKIHQFVADKIHHFLDYDPTKEAMVYAALQQQDYFTALEGMPVLQSLLTITDVHDHFSELRQFKNQSLQINIENPNASEIETHLLILKEAIEEAELHPDNTSAITNKIPGLIQCIVASAKMDVPGVFSHLSLRFKCNALLIQVRDLLKENKAIIHAADNEEKPTISPEKITAIITSYHKNKYHWFGRKQWVCDQDKASADILEKLEDQTVSIKEKEALLFNVVKRSTQVDMTLFKVINRSLPVDASAPRRTRGAA